jgi:hypothetical protein
MQSPFPGMDPYLESPDLWPDFQFTLLLAVATQLTDKLRPNFVARVDMRTWRMNATERFRVPVRFLVIRKPRSTNVVTHIELIGPAEKVEASPARQALLQRRELIGLSDSSWLEIDLLRGGHPTFEQALLPRGAYRAYCDRTVAPKVEHHRRQMAWAIGLRESLPVLPVPLRPGRDDIPLDLQSAADAAYVQAGDDLSIDYSRPTIPPLESDDARWADELLKSRGLRP